MSHATLEVERRGAALWIRLNRPDVLNAISAAMMTDLQAVLDAAAAERDVRALVLTGAGRAFCAGADLTDVRDSSAGEGDALGRFLNAGLNTLRALERFPRPVIGAVNGLACGGGLELLLCCDVILAQENAKLGDAHANFGVLPGGGASYRLPRRVGAARAKLLMFTGELLPARDLLAWGLVDRVVAADHLETAAADLVAKLADKSPLGLARMKRLIDDGVCQDTDTALRNELVMMELHRHSHDYAEGLRAFAEKRKPTFTGR